MLNKMLPGGSPTYENREASGAVANFTTNTVQPFVKCECEILPIQEGTGTPSPSNPRPISGTDELTLNQRGKNLFDLDNLTGTGITIQNGEASGRAYDFSSNFNQSQIPMYVPPVQFTLQCTAYVEENTSGATIGLYFRIFYTDGTYTNLLFSNVNTTPTTNSVTTTAGKTPKEIAISYSTGSNNVWHLTDIQIELGSTATTYEPYNAETYTFDLGQEIMGGTDDVVGGSGESEWGYFASYNGETINEPWLSSIDAYVEGTLPSIGAEVVYKLATPTPFTFTGQPIRSFLGVNNVWTDRGDTKVTYKTGEGGSSNKKYLPIFYDFYRKEKYK